jgi:TonB family protein
VAAGPQGRCAISFLNLDEDKEPVAAPAPPQYLGQQTGGEFEVVLLQELQNDLARARLREIIYVTVVFHLIVVLLMVFVPRWFPVHEKSLEEQLRDRQMTTLLMPDDMPNLKTPPPAKTPGTKTRQPQVDRKTLEEIRKNEPAPAPVPAAPAPAAPQPVVPPQMARNTAPEALHVPQQPQSNPFANQHSATSSLSQALHGSGGGGGGIGDMRGMGPGGAGKVGNGVEILSDTQGVDFNPYMRRVVHDVEQNWYRLIPEEAMPPLLKRGRVIIEFYIMPNGKVMGMKIVGYSGDVPLDRAAFGGITASNPFPPLPSEFHGPYLALRFSFYYNPQPGELPR